MNHNCLFKRIFLPALLFLFSWSATAQETDFAKPGPSGVFLFLGNTVPSGKLIAAYSIERREQNGPWKKIASVKTPSDFGLFSASVTKAKSYFPSQVLPNETRLRAVYEKALHFGTVDSLSGWKQYPVRIGLGIMYYDQNPPKAIGLTYRVSELSDEGSLLASRVSDPVSLPYSAVFDSIYVAELSHSGQSLYIKWCSTGKNAPPLFTVYRFDDRKPVAVSGKFGRFTVNDTTYYTYTDSLLSAGPFKEKQYFLVPYDLLGNAAKSSQIALFPDDDFGKMIYKRFMASNMMERGGIKLSWRISNPLPVEKITLFRSESPSQGFVKYQTFKSNDTVWVDENTWPDRVYYYYLSAYVKNGKRIKNSETVSASAFFPTKPLPPVISRSGLTERGITLSVESNDPRVAGIRIFRGSSLTESFTDISGLLAKKSSQPVIFTDTTVKAGRKPLYYVARIECSDQLVSDLSAPVSVMPAMRAFPDDPSYLRVFDDEGMIKLFWEDLAQNDNSLTGYVLERKVDGGEPEVIAGGKVSLLVHPNYDDQEVVPGKKYSYTVKAVDRTGNMSLKGAAANKQFWGDQVPVVSGLKASSSGKQILITWDDLQHPSISRFNIYRYEKGADPQVIATSPAGTFSFTDENTTRKRTYHYFITVVNSAGAEGNRTAEVTVKLD